MAFRDSLKKYREAQGSQTTNSSASSTTPAGATTQSTFSDKLQRYRESQATVSLQSWADNSLNLIKDVQDRASRWYDSKEYESMEKRFSVLLSHADNWRSQYAGNEEAVSYINSVTDALSKAKEASYSYLQHYSQWDNMYDYSTAKAAWQEYYDQWGHYADAEDFKEYSAKGAGIKNPTYSDAEGSINLFGWRPGAEDVGNIVTYSRDNYKQLVADMVDRYDSVGDHRYLYMKDDEVAIYNYLLAKEGGDAAQKFLDYMEETLNAREGGQIADNITGIDIPVIEDLAKLSYGLGAGVDQFGSGVKQLVSGDKLPTSSTQYASAQIADSLDGFGKYAYTAATTIGNMAPSILVSTLTGGVGGAVAGKIAGAATMATSAAGNAYGQALDMGYNKLQARAYSTLVGASEGALQYAIGGITKLGGNALKINADVLGKIAAIDNSLLRISAKLGWETFKEIGEEELQNYLEPLFRTIITGEEYDAPTIDEVLETAIVTILSTGALEGPGTIAGDVKNSRYYTNTYGNVQRELVDQALEGGDFANPLAQKYQQKLDNGGSLTGHQIGRLVEANEQQFIAEDMAAIQNAAESRLTELGETEDVSAIAAALTKKAAGKTLSRAESKMIAESMYGERVANELNTDNISSGNYASSWAENIGTERINADSYNADLIALAMEKSGASAQTAPNVAKTAQPPQFEEITSSKGNLPTVAENASESHYEVSEDGNMVNTKTGDTIEPQGLVQAEDGTYMIAAKDANPVSPGDVSYADNNQALVYETFVNLEKHSGKISKVIADMNLASRNELIGLYNPKINKDGGTFVNGILNAYFYGHRGIDMATASKDSPMFSLTPEQRAIAWNTGKAAGIQSTNAAQSNVDSVYAEAKNILESGKAKKGSYHAVLEDGISPMQLNKAQKATYRLADEIAQGVQTNIRVYAGKDKAQGFYNHDTDEIWLNLNAADTGREAIMAFTLAHEIVHRSKKGSPAKYQAFVDFLMKEYGKQGSDVEAMIAEQIAAAERFNKTVPDSKKVNMTREKALEEVVCDACQRMLLDTNAGQKLAEFGAQSRENKSFLEDLKRWITELLDKLRRYFKNAEPDSLAAKEFAKFDANVKQILADMYVDMSIEAGEKLSTIKAAYGGEFAQKFHGLKDISYNLAATESHKDKLQKEYSEDSSTDLDTIMKRYDKILDIWTRLGGELNSKFLADWNSKVGKDRSFTIFKAQAGYKYNVELSSMCKKGVPLFEAIDTIVKKEVMKELEIDVLGKAEKEILYDILKQHHFEIPCAICYVEQARQREGVIIDAFLNGKVETNAKGVTTKVKLGWNQVLDSIEKEMKANGVDYSFAQVSRDIATEKYIPADLSMDSKTQVAFYAALKKIANQEITRYNKAEGKSRKLLSEVTPEAVKECFKGTLPANLNIFKVMFNESESLFKIQKDLLYSSIATQNLSMAHNKLYGLFNMQGGVSGYKTKQGTTIYWGDILGKSWKPDTLRNEGGVRNQSNSDFQMYTLLDQAQMYMDFTAKGYYLQAYTKVLSELKLFGLSRGKINASLIPKVVVYRNADGSVDVEKTMANAGLDENGNPIYDDIEGINHDEAFMLIEDPEYSKSICGICIGYSDAHINKLLDDNRVQQIIGFHDKTDDGTKRYKGARYAKNYNGLNEAVNKEGKTIHIGFNPYVKKAEKKFKFNAETETYEGTVNYNGKTYTADDIPRLAADLYLEMCVKKEYTPAYKDFAGHRNYYKLLADFGLYDSQGHYAPHRKVVYNMPDTVPYLDANGKKQTMSSYDYIKAELVKELTVRDSIAEALADTSEEGIIPQFKAAVKKSQEEKSFSLPKTDSEGNQLTAEQQEYFKDSQVRDKKGNLLVVYHGTTANFNIFKKGDVGFHFGTKGAARGRAGYGKNVNIKAVYLNITNPIVFDEDLGSWDADYRLAKELYNRGILTHDEAMAVLYTDDRKYKRATDVANKKLASVLQAKGYDGIAYQNTFETKKATTSYIAFSSNQAKEIANISPTSNPDIRYSLPKTDSDGKQLSEDQQEFFEKSRVRDAQGRLKVVYHGGTVEYEFDTTRGGNGATQYGPGSYFTDSEYYAKEYTWYRGGNVRPFYLNIEKMFDDTNISTTAQMPEWNKLVEILQRNGIEEKFINGFANNGFAYMSRYLAVKAGAKTSSSWEGSEKLNAMLREAGFQGIKGDLNDSYQYVIFTPNQAKLTTNEVPSSFFDIRYSLPKITEDMSDTERYAILEDATISVQSDDGSAAYIDQINSLAELGDKAKSKAEKIIIPLAKDLGILNKSMSAADVDIEFIFSKGNGLQESLSKQLRYGGNYADFAKTIINLDKVINSAVLIEKHGDKYKGTSRENRNLEAVFVMVSAFRDGDYVIPIQLEIKKSSDVGGRLYLTVAMTKIEASVLGGTIDNNQAFPLIPASITYNLADIFREINPKDRHFLKYLPDGFLSEAQKEAKRMAIEEDNARIASYKLPIGEDTSPRALLANAFEGIVTNDIEKRRLQEYKGKVEMLNAEEQKLHELRAEIKELSFVKGKRDTKRIKELQFEAIHTANRIATLDKMLLRLEAAAPLQSILKREKEMAYKRAEQKGKEALEAYRKAERERDKQWQSEVKEKYQASKQKAIETRDKREAREKLQKLVLDTVKWISYPSKTDVKCPDILKQPYADFLNGIDLSSQRLAKGGDPTKNDLRLANAMSSLATALDKVMTSQDPTQETTAVLDTGYLDLPANFVQKLRDMTEDVKAMMGDSEYVVNNMPAEEIRKLSQMIRTLNHAIKEVSTLYANLRFANVEELGENTMSFVDALGEIEKTGGIKDFVQWDNALPYYAFKRFGEGGESIFEGLMDAQDKLAFLAQKIFDFREKAWTDKEAKAWSEDTHTIDLHDGNTLTLTTADAMSIYCLSRRQQGLQHLLAGGIRVMGIQKGSQKAKDSRSLLTIKDIDAIISSLTDRQKKVADAVQEFMSTVCSDWGNEISMKRFLTKEFNEKFYFPIESNDENLATKDPSAQQSDLFRLLNISATKPIDPRANNEVIIRNIFDVFTNHASDMARLNAYGMALLDYMKWLNYREKTVNDEGQINVRGVRKSMEKAYGTAARSYVLNLVKDVNGRPSDNGDPTMLMKWMRNAKIASVGANLRVAALQFTAYPRAAMVLSTKSISLGLTKVPQIEKAKKYCGIALWKSFGFYDTNIARSIEDQMKGATNIRQKIIELTMKGAELGDAITWGALWNACEYEVAATKKYKVGTEEFYQAVGKKLREVVYATQVVDSTLTRTQLMRSKRGMAQEAASFMSEPAIGSNILMDARFQFVTEKRKTGSVKVALQKTSKHIGRAIAVYGSVALLAALVESLGDAWRDDDDEEFYAKFFKALPQNLLLNVLPFNKVPILSDLVDMVLSSVGIGFFSSEKLSTQWLSLTNSAVDAWGDVLSGNSSVTPYNALYKTVKAISSGIGLPIGNSMREAVALWNNTAGVYDTTLKVRQYDLSKADLGAELYRAIISGDTEQADSLKAQFEDPAAMSSALRKALRENDPRIKDAAQAQVNGDPSERVRIAKQIIADGFTEDDVKAAINTEINSLTSTGSTSSNTKKVSGYYDADDFAREIVNGDITAANTAMDDIIETSKKNGKTQEEAEESFTNSVTTAFRNLYEDGEIDSNAAMKYLTTYCGMDEDDAYWKIQEWEYEVENEGEEFKKYNNFYTAVETGKNLKAVIKEYTDNGVEAKTLASQITSYFKPRYIEMTNSQRAGIKGYLLNAYEVLGYDRAKKSKDIDKWLEK